MKDHVSSAASKMRCVVLLALALMLSGAVAHGADNDLAGKRVAVLIGEGFHDGETLFPLGYLANRGAKVTVIGIAPGMAKAYNSSVKVRIERAVDKVKPSDFDALILPGGKGPAVLRKNDDVVAFAKAFFESGKPVAGICHGPQVLVTAGVLKGCACTAIEGIKGELTESGAAYRDAELVIDRNLITSRLPKDLPAFVEAIAQALAKSL